MKHRNDSTVSTIAVSMIVHEPTSIAHPSSAITLVVRFLFVGEGLDVHLVLRLLSFRFFSGRLPKLLLHSFHLQELLHGLLVAKQGHFERLFPAISYRNRCLLSLFHLFFYSTHLQPAELFFLGFLFPHKKHLHFLVHVRRSFKQGQPRPFALYVVHTLSELLLCLPQ